MNGLSRDEIIRMAREAGLCIDGEVAFSPNHNGADVDINDLQTFAALVAAAERDVIADMVSNCDPRATPKGIAAAIRTRGNDAA